MGVRVLGPLEIGDSDRPVKIGGPREQIVLAMLAQRANRVTSVDQLMDAIWGDVPPSTARGQIQGCISGLRKLLGEAGLPKAIETRSSGYLLTLSDDDLDSSRFAILVASAHQQEADGQLADAAATLRSALELWRGPALDGVESDLVQRGASPLEDARITAIEERLRLDLELGRHHEISAELRALLAEHPLRERMYAFQMLALYRSGRQAEALAVCRQARKTLIAEVGVEPCQELQDLEHAVLNRDPALDLHPGADHPPATADNQAASPRQLPRQLPSSIADFIGRESHIEEISRILTGPGRSDIARYAVPIIGICGRGGVGKSTLALRAAHESGEAYPDGHLYLDLRGPVGEDRTPMLLARLLRALSVSGSVIPDDPDERAEMYRSRLANKRLLLVLDDVTSEEQVLPLLPGSPSCAVIVTSRTRLDCLDGAHWIGIDAFDRDTSMEMLGQIVGPGRLDAEQDAAEELVQYCGGLPLALRIAGARLASRPHWRIAELCRRMKNEVSRLDEFSHHGLELRSSIGLSYRSLPESAKRLFRLFSLIQASDFPGWTAAALLDISMAEADETLERLVDVQLLDTVRTQSQRVRYRFHDLIRVYAHEQLMATEIEAERHDALARVIGGWLALAEKAHRDEYGGDYTILHGSAPRFHLAGWVDESFQDSPMDWLENERGALLSTVRQAAAAGMDELCWDLALTSVCLFEVRGYFDDWRETAELAHDASTQAGNQIGRAAMQYSLGTLNMIQKQLTDAATLFASAHEIFQSEGNIHGEALVLRNWAYVDLMRGNSETMLAKYQEALVKMRAVGDLVGEANILRSLAKFRIDEGDVDEASRMLSEALALCQSVNFARGQAQVQNRFAELYMSTGQLTLARQTLDRVLVTVRQMGDRIGEAHTLYGLGIVRRREGKLETAEAILLHALSIAEEVGDRLIAGQAHYALGELAVARADNAVAAKYLAKATIMFGDLDSTLWLAKTLILLAEVDETPAVEHLNRATRLLHKLDSKQAARLLRHADGERGALAGVESIA